MRKTVIGFLLLATAGCGTDAAGPAPKADPEDAYILELRNTLPDPTILQNEKVPPILLDQGRAVCGMVKEGGTPNEARATIVNAGGSNAQATAVVNAALGTLCSEVE